jgi:hypothetical protein
MARRLFVRSLLLLLAVAAGGAWARYCPGCIERRRVNASCDWTGDSPYPPDGQAAAQRRHLIADAQLAEELAVRYADAEFNRHYGYDGHGGLEGSARATCMTRLVATIARSHRVGPAQVDAQRGRRNAFFDLVAAASFVPMFVLMATLAGGALDHRFSTERATIRTVAVGLTSAALSFLGLQVGQLWLSVWETIRVRNGHISVFRSASRTVWTHQYGWVLFACGVAVCWMAARRRRATLRRVSREATMVSGTMLAAMFAEVFIEHAVGYVLVTSALLVFLRVVSVDRAPDLVPQGVLLR